jgi:hypothetical protein
MTFKCGHPRAGNDSYGQCRFCARMRSMVAVNERRQERVNAGLPVEGHVGAIGRSVLR